MRQIEEATGKPVNRSADGSGSPFADLEFDQAAISERIADIIAAGESKVAEFKSTGRKNLRTGEKDPAIEWSVVKSIAGFMNAHGGTLLVGVTDDGTVVGIEEDYPFLGKKDADSWELWLTDLLCRSLGKTAAADVLATAELLDAMVAHYSVLPRSVAALHQHFTDVDQLGSDGFFRKVGGEIRFVKGKKHRGEPLDIVAANDPAYLEWMLAQDFFEDTKAIVRRALTSARATVQAANDTSSSFTAASV